MPFTDDDLEPPIPEDLVARLWPEIEPERRREAAENLAGYIEVTLRIFDRIRNDPEAWARFQALTRAAANDTLEEAPSQQP